MYVHATAVLLSIVAEMPFRAVALVVVIMALLAVLPLTYAPMHMIGQSQLQIYHTIHNHYVTYLSLSLYEMSDGTHQFFFAPQPQWHALDHQPKLRLKLSRVWISKKRTFSNLHKSDVYSFTTASNGSGLSSQLKFTS